MEDYRLANLTLSNTYHVTATLFPIGIRMRWVPGMSDLHGQMDSIKKATLLRGRQSQFKAMMKMTVNDEITLMDVVDKEKDKSLRDLIMDIEHQKKAGVKVFHSVSKMKNSIKYMFHYIPDNADMAVMIANGLIPYMKGIHGDWTDTCFDGNSAMSKSEWYWDAEEETIISPSAKHLDAIIDKDVDFIFVLPDSMKGVLEEENDITPGILV